MKLETILKDLGFVKKRITSSIVTYELHTNGVGICLWHGLIYRIYITTNYAYELVYDNVKSEFEILIYLNKLIHDANTNQKSD